MTPCDRPLQKTLLLLTMLLAACASRQPLPPAELAARPGGVVSVKIEQFGICNTAFDHPVDIDPSRELVVVVHGCSSSAGQYELVANAFKTQGKQAYCFNYDDRDRISDSALQLAQVLEQLVKRVGVRKLTVVGHSQGGLIARRALVSENGISLADSEIRLVTISAPFGGIRSAAHCASTTRKILSLGIVQLACQIVAGNKWSEIPPGVALVRQPGILQPAVRDHLKIITDESNSCRHRNDQGRCIEDDEVFAVEEQRQAVVDSDPRMREYLVKAGHVEIVGSGRNPPRILIDILTKPIPPSKQ